MDSAASKGKRDFFSLVAQVSPQGSAAMEDLAVLDAGDPNQWLLIVAVREGNDTNIYRRLYHDGRSVSVHELPAADSAGRNRLQSAVPRHDTLLAGSPGHADEDRTGRTNTLPAIDSLNSSRSSVTGVISP